MHHVFCAYNTDYNQHYLCSISLVFPPSSDSFVKKYATIEKHDLIHEFPSYRDKINEMKTGSNRFRKLYDEYQDVDLQIHRIEEGETPTTDEHLNELRLKRVHLKDSLYKMLLQ